MLLLVQRLGNMGLDFCQKCKIFDPMKKVMIEIQYAVSMNYLVSKSIRFQNL